MLNSMKYLLLGNDLINVFMIYLSVFRINLTIKQYLKVVLDRDTRTLLTYVLSFKC